ncbi:MAG: HIT domain-containing protein [Candidatus Brocadiia bacterium]
MDRLWAPWRSEFVSQLSEDHKCFLCKIAAAPSSDGENFVLLRGKSNMALLNRFPYNTGHLLVSPYAHVSSISQMDDAAVLEMFRMTDTLIAALKIGMKAGGFNVGFNLGRAAGAGLEDHIHLHIVPRWAGDTNFMPVLADTKVLPHDLPTVFQILTSSLRA